MTAMVVAGGCKKAAESDNKADPAVQAAKPAEGTPVPGKAATPVVQTPAAGKAAPATPAGTLVDLFQESKTTPLTLKQGTLTGTLKGQTVEFLWNGATVGSCETYEYEGNWVQAMHKDGHVYVICQDDNRSYGMQKFKVGASLTLVGKAGRAGELDFGKVDALLYEMDAASATPVSKRWLELVSSGDAAAAKFTAFPFVLRTKLKKSACKGANNASEFTSKTLPCLQKEMRPQGHTEWDTSSADFDDLIALLKGATGGFDKFSSVGEGVSTMVVVFTGDDGRVSHVAYDFEFFE